MPDGSIGDVLRRALIPEDALFADDYKKFLVARGHLLAKEAAQLMGLPEPEKYGLAGFVLAMEDTRIDVQSWMRIRVEEVE
jgi:hypothetical protein